MIMFWAKICSTTSCAVCGAHPASRAATSCFEKRGRPAFWDATPCRAFGCQKPVSDNTPCPLGANTLPRFWVLERHQQRTPCFGGWNTLLLCEETPSFVGDDVLPCCVGDCLPPRSSHSLPLACHYGAGTMALSLLTQQALLIW